MNAMDTLHRSLHDPSFPQIGICNYKGNFGLSRKAAREILLVNEIECDRLMGTFCHLVKTRVDTNYINCWVTPWKFKSRVELLADLIKREWADNAIEDRDYISLAKGRISPKPAQIALWLTDPPCSPTLVGRALSLIARETGKGRRKAFWDPADQKTRSGWVFESASLVK